MSQDQEITALDQRTVERIAAGEVVERPASAVKELLENSIDADADRVTVAVEDGGKGSIRVTDDGIGMSREAVQRAVEEHTTSKIGDIRDLESGVGTLGFRGEALHAIGAVSRLTITTRPRGGDRGTELTVEGGEVTDVSPAGCPEGTTAEVTDLFYNVPARRKYLKQTATEFAHVNTVVTSYALANPDVAVTLEHDGRETFATNGTGDLRETVLAVYGREVAEAMIDVDADSLPDGPLDGVSGLVSHPETNRASREYCSVFVNGRYVTSNTVREAVFEAYGGQLGPDRYPFAVLRLDLDPATVDVNVHPRKLEVRFAAEDQIRDQIETAVERALLREGLVRSSAPRGKSAPEETAVDPGSTAEGSDGPRLTQETIVDASGDSPSDGSAEDVTTSNPDRTVDDDSRAAAEGDETADAVTRTETTTRETQTEQEPSPPSEAGGATPSPGTERPGEDGTDLTGPEQASEDDGPEPTVPTGSTADDAAGRKFTGNADQARLGDDASPADGEFESLPHMEILGQFRETYIVAESRDGLVLIDQHAADERINYERLREQFEGDTTTQALADPVELELTAREAELFAAHEDALATLGFHASLVDDRRVRVTTVPSLVAETAGPALIRDVLGDLVTGEAAAASTVEAAADELLADLACHPSITGNTSLTDGSVVDLLARLDDCENPYACPHGRPVVVELDTDELEARFERDYPGHGG
jgi:DNA mismatch repair protein MutL